jgi:folate/biopterin transporter
MDPRPESAERRPLIGNPASESGLSSTTRFFVVVFMSFFAKGILETMPGLSVSYYYKDTLKLTPTQTSALGSMMTLPWTLKPLYGFMSDNFPIFGYRRKSYVLLAGTCVTICYILLAVGHHTTFTFVGLQFMATFFMAVSNVVAEALTVEKSRGLSQVEAGKYQSLIWGTNSLANCLGSFFGGYVLKYIDAQIVFGICAVFPMMMGLAAQLTPEEKMSRSDILDSGDQRPKSLREYLNILVTSVSRPTIWRPVLVVFLIFATPSMGTASFFFLTNDLKMSSTILGVLGLVGSIASMMGIGMYQLLFRDTPIRKLILLTTVFGSAIGCTGIILYTHFNRKMGIPDKVFLLTDNVVVSAVGQLSQMPVLTLGARLCPPGVEGSMFSLLTSIMNAGSFVSGEEGAVLTKMLGITAHKFDNLWLLCLIANMSSFLPFVLLRWIPWSTDDIHHDTEPVKRSKVRRASAAPRLACPYSSISAGIE